MRYNGQRKSKMTFDHVSRKGGYKMNAEKYTQKSLEAVRDAQEIAIRNQNMQIDQQHLLLALIKQEGGLIAQMLKKMKVDANRMVNTC